MSPGLVIIGAGGLARETYSAWRAGTGLDGLFHGFVSSPGPEPALIAMLGAAWLGDESTLSTLESQTPCVIGIGDGRVRSRLSRLVEEKGLTLLSVRHPSAHIGHDVEVGDGSILLGHTSFTTHVRLGRGVLVNPAVTVAHDCIIGDFVSLSPAATVCGRVRIDDFAFIGANATLLPGVHIGEGAVVGAGAVVTADVAPGRTVVGIPARPVRD